MKGKRGGFQPQRNEQLLEGLGHDSYKAKAKLPEPTRCPDCGAVFRRGRWTWGEGPAGANEQVCPACRRIRDRFPAGHVTLAGRFFLEHRDEILSLVSHCEEKEKAAHPVQRIMAIEDSAEGVVVTTTDVHLARSIAEKVHESYKGSLAIRYGKDDNLLRATWTR